MPHQPQAMVEVRTVVQDTSGRPVQDVHVQFRPVSSPASVVTYYEFASTDSHGLCSVSLYPGTYEITAHLGGFAEHDVWTGRVAFDRSQDELAITISGVRVTGTVLTPTGALLDSGYVFGVGIGPSGEEMYVDARFRTGVFEIFAREGTYRFISYPMRNYSGLPAGRVEGVPVHADTTIQIEMRGDPVSGTVTGRGGIPLEDAVVEASGSNGAETRTEPDGTYRLYLPAGVYRFRISPAESWILSRTTTLQSISGTSTFDLSVDGVTWSGTVRLAGVPGGLPGVAVQARMFGDDARRAAVDTTDAAGEFQVLLEPAREYVLEVFLQPSYTPEFLHPGLVANADTTFDVVLDPPPYPGATPAPPGARDTLVPGSSAP